MKFRFRSELTPKFVGYLDLGFWGSFLSPNKNSWRKWEHLSDENNQSAFQEPRPGTLFGKSNRCCIWRRSQGNPLPKLPHPWYLNNASLPLSPVLAKHTILLCAVSLGPWLWDLCPPPHTHTCSWLETAAWVYFSLVYFNITHMHTYYSSFFSKANRYTNPTPLPLNPSLLFPPQPRPFI